MKSQAFSPLVAVAILAACGEQLPEPRCDVVLAGDICLEVATVSSVIDVDRWSLALEMSAKYWGASLEDLEGIRIGLSEEPIHCGEYSGAHGCWEEKKIWLYSRPGDPCPEYYLPHEVGHVLIGDEHHSDPRFALSRLALRDLPGCSHQ